MSIPIEDVWRPDYIQKILEAIGPLDRLYESPPLKVACKGTDAMHTLSIVSRINTPTPDDLAHARLAALGCYRMIEVLTAAREKKVATNA